MVKVQLADVSRAHAPAVVLGVKLIEAAGRQVPLAFVVAYDPEAIDERMSYAVQALIEAGGWLLCISDQRQAVITRSAPARVDLVLKVVSGACPRIPRQYLMLQPLQRHHLANRS